MSDSDATIGRGAAVAEAALWVGAGIVMLAVHVGGAAMILREPPLVVADDAPPVAIMIELAPEPEALFTETNEIAPDTETAAPSPAVEEATSAPEEAPPEEVAEPVEPDPADMMAQAAPEEPEPELPEVAEIDDASDRHDDLILPDGVDVPLPVSRPAPPQPKAPMKEAARKPAPRVQPARSASVPAMRAQAQVRQSDRNAGRLTASGSSSMSPARWQSRLMAYIERRKRYPSAARARGEEGTVHVRFSIDGSGNVLSVTLVRSSGFAALDEEVLSLVRRVSPVPPPPPGSAKTITVPIRFSTR